MQFAAVSGEEFHGIRQSRADVQDRETVLFINMVEQWCQQLRLLC